MPFSKNKLITSITISNDDKNKQLVLDQNIRWYKMFTSVVNNIINQETGANFDASDVANLFCSDGILSETQSTNLRTSPQSIEEYFEFLVNIPGITITNIENNISKVT